MRGTIEWKRNSPIKDAKCVLTYPINSVICKVENVHSTYRFVLLFCACLAGENSTRPVLEILEMEASKNQETWFVVCSLVAESAETHEIHCCVRFAVMFIAAVCYQLFHFFLGREYFIFIYLILLANNFLMILCTCVELLNEHI